MSLSIVAITYRQAGDVSAALELYESLDCSSTEELCGYGLALYKTKQYDVSLEVYQRALDACPEESTDRSHVYAIMGMVTHAATGDVDATKAMLFKW